MRLIGEREGGRLRTEGADAACVNCHHRSGLGTTEGRIVIPPIADRYLFHARKTDFDEAGFALR
jgi:cytochrome c553